MLLSIYKRVLVGFLALWGSALFGQLNFLQVQQITTEDGLPQNSVQTIKQDKYGFMWFSSFASICKYDGYNFTQFYPETDNQTTIFSNGVYNFILDSLEQIWIGFFDTSYYCKYNYVTNDFSRILKKNVPGYIQSSIYRGRQPIIYAENTKNEQWEYINGKLIKTDLITGLKNEYCLGLSGNQPIKGVTSIFYDKFGIIWMGTENQGVYKVNTKTKPFYTLYDEGVFCRNNIDEIVRAVHAAKNGVIWLGTNSEGLIRYNRKTGNESLYLWNDQNPSNKIVDNAVRALTIDRDGWLWIGTKGGVSVLGSNENVVKTYTRNSQQPIPHPWAHSIYEDQLGKIWIGTFYGLVIYDKQKDSFFPLDPLITLKNAAVSCVTEDNKQNIWVATQGGGVTMLKRTGRELIFDTLHFTNIPGQNNSLSSNRVFNVLCDTIGNVWAATDLGLNKINTATGKITRFTKKQGLTDLMIMGMIDDRNGNLWLSHKKGITKMNMSNYSMQHFSFQDGLRSNNFSENAFYRNPNTGEVFFGNDHGVNSFYPDSIKQSETDPDVFLTGLQVLNQDVKVGQLINDKAILEKDIAFTDEIRLRHDHKSFSLFFSALHYINPEANQYQYILEGFDKDWAETDASHRMASYSNLAPGKYTFRVKATNNDGIWSKNEARLDIVILPPWWVSVWAYLAYSLVLILFLYWIYHYIISRERLKAQIRYEKLKAQKSLELDQLKMQFFTNVSHELRTPLTLLVDPLNKLKNNEVDAKKVSYYYELMYKNAQHLLRLVNQLLDFRKVENKIRKVELKYADLSLFLKNISEAFRITANDRNINFTFNCQQEEIMGHFDPDKIEKIVFNLVSNAFKYSPDNGQVSIGLELIMDNTDSERSVLITVKDSGRGIPAHVLEKIFDPFFQDEQRPTDRKGSGIGLSLAKDIIDQLNGEVNVESELEKGTTFTVVLPIGEEINTEYDAMLEWEETIDEENIKGTNPDLQFIHNTKGSNKLSLLIVEDNKDIRDYLKNELSDEYRIIEAENGKDGLKMTYDRMPDIVISDIMMPQMDGMEFCRKLKTDLLISHIPVVLLTARHSEEFIVEGYETGADAYITKPFNTKVLKARLKNLINVRVSLQELYDKNPFFDLKKIAGNKANEDFLNLFIEKVKENISEPEFNFEMLAQTLKMSKRQLAHKIKTLTGLTLKEFVKTTRLNIAAELLLTTDHTVSEVAYKMGYNVPANFTRSFTKQFGQSPTEFVASYSKKS